MFKKCLKKYVIKYQDMKAFQPLTTRYLFFNKTKHKIKKINCLIIYHFILWMPVKLTLFLTSQTCLFFTTFKKSLELVKNCYPIAN